jgi:uncharacterized protein YjiS (DUF1127 family)
MTQNTQSLPPYVKFVQRAVEDRSLPEVSGKYGSKDVDFAEITRPGQNDTVEREVGPWLSDMQKRVENGLVPSTWLEHFQKQYAAWKEGQELPEEGTPVRLWPAVGPAQVEELLHLKIRTVEALAQLDDGALSRIGTGAVTLRNRARAWVEAAGSIGTTAAKLERLEVENDTLKTQVADMRKQLEAIASRKVLA